MERPKKVQIRRKSNGRPKKNEKETHRKQIGRHKKIGTVGKTSMEEQLI